MLRATHHHQHHNHKYYMRTCVIQLSGTEYDRSCVRIHFLLQHSAARVFVVALQLVFFVAQHATEADLAYAPH